VTALNPVLGYEKSTEIADQALKSGRSVYELVLERGYLTKEQVEHHLSPESMTHPRYLNQ
jgi:aspartate ammonia-lyase